MQVAELCYLSECMIAENKAAVALNEQMLWFVML